MDPETSSFWVVTILGFLISAFYLHYNRIEDPKTMKIPSSWRHFEYFRLEYEQLSNGIRSRDNMTIVAGTILITASVILLASCIDLASRELIGFWTKTMMIFASLAIYVIWLICLNLTSNKLNNISYARLRKMEQCASDPCTHESIDMELHRYISKQTHDKLWYKILRRTVWVLFLWVLVITSAFAILL